MLGLYYQSIHTIKVTCDQTFRIIDSDTKSMFIWIKLFKKILGSAFLERLFTTSLRDGTSSKILFLVRSL